MVRSILLRGFDQQIANIIGDDMESTHGIRFIRSVRVPRCKCLVRSCRTPLSPAPLQCVPTAIVKLADGRLSVTFKNAETSEVREEAFDTVLTATGRVADTSKLGLELAGVNVGPE